MDPNRSSQSPAVPVRTPIRRKVRFDRPHVGPPPSLGKSRGDGKPGK